MQDAKITGRCVLIATTTSVQLGKVHTAEGGKGHEVKGSVLLLRAHGRKAVWDAHLLQRLSCTCCHGTAAAQGSCSTSNQNC